MKRNSYGMLAVLALVGILMAAGTSYGLTNLICDATGCAVDFADVADTCTAYSGPVGYSQLPSCGIEGWVIKWSGTSWGCGQDSTGAGYTQGTGILINAGSISADIGTGAAQVAAGNHGHAGGDITSAVANATDSDLLDGQHASAFASAGTLWGLTGNSGTTPGTHFIGTTDNQAVEVKVNNGRVLRFEPGASPNIIGGLNLNSATAGVVGATIGGGGASTGCGSMSSSPCDNTVNGNYGTVGGGMGNRVGPGQGAPYATVGGGSENNAGSLASTVAGGAYNNANGISSTVGGGGGNAAWGIGSTVPGGWSNVAGGDYSFAAGKMATVRTAAIVGDSDGDEGTFVWADALGSSFTSTGPNQFLVRAAGGVGINKNNPATALDVNGTVTATAFAGNGSGLTNITAGTVTGTITSAATINLNTSPSTASGVLSYDATNDRLGVGDGAATDYFYPGLRAGSAADGGPATTALALNADPVACAGGAAATDIAANGTLTCSNALTITGGSINNTPVGATTASTGAFTALTVSDTAAIGTTRVMDKQLNVLAGFSNPFAPAYAGYFETLTQYDATGVYGKASSVTTDSGFAHVGVKGLASGASYNHGVDAEANEATATENYGVSASARNGATNYGVLASATSTASTNYGVYARASGATNNYAGYFDGRLMVYSSAGVNWDPAATEGDLKIGNNTQRLKIGVATTGGGAGIGRIYSHGTTEKIVLGTASSIGVKDMLAVTQTGVTINTASLNPGAYALYVTGDVAYTGTLTDVSDERLKEHIRPVKNALAKVEAINGVYFTMKETPDQTEVGVLAQDVQKVLPEAVRVINTEKGYLGVSYPSLIPVLIEAAKELKSELRQKDDRIAKLEKALDELTQRLAAMELSNSRYALK